MRSLVHAPTSAIVAGLGGPKAIVVVGSVAVATTPIILKYAAVSSATASFYRSILALPLLVVMAVVEWRSRGPLPRTSLVILGAGGLMLGVDFALFATSVAYAGAGVASVLVNVQVIVLPLVAWAVFGETPRRVFALMVPVMALGIVMTAGGFGSSSQGAGALTVSLLAIGAGLAYSVYLLVISRVDTAGRAGTQVLVTLAGSGVAGTLVGSLWGPVDFTPGWGALGWLVLLSIGCSAIGWLLIGSALYHLRSEVAASLLLLQPIISLLFGIGLLGERPSRYQLIGCAIVIVAVWIIGRAGPQARMVKAEVGDRDSFGSKDGRSVTSDEKPSHTSCLASET